MAYAAGRRFTTPPTLGDIEAMAREAYASIPTFLRRHCDGVVIRVVDFPSDEVLEEMDCETPFDILGLYQGIDLTRRSFADQPEDLDVVYLYRRPILDYWSEMEEDLMHVVRHVLIHEIGHHFGYSDDDMERIEAQA